MNIFIFYYYFSILYGWVFFPVHMSVHICAQWPQRPEEDIGPPGTVVAYGCELTCREMEARPSTSHQCCLLPKCIFKTPFWDRKMAQGVKVFATKREDLRSSPEEKWPLKVVLASIYALWCTHRNK